MATHQWLVRWAGSRIQHAAGSVYWQNCLWLQRTGQRRSWLKRTKRHRGEGALLGTTAHCTASAPQRACVCVTKRACVCVWERKWERAREGERGRGRVDVCALLHSHDSVNWMMLAGCPSLSLSLCLRCLAVPLSAEHWWTILCYIVLVLLPAASLSFRHSRRHLPFPRRPFLLR